MEKTNAAAVKRIAITGPESTGKSWLASRLANHFNTLYVPEAAREYLAKLNRDYTLFDLTEIARIQLNSERDFEKKADRLLLYDTELSVIKIWSEVRFGKCDPWILEQYVQQSFDLYLLCNIDIPWEADPLREHPFQREFLMNRYTSELQKMQRKFVIINGMGEERLQNAIKAINELLYF